MSADIMPTVATATGWRFMPVKGDSMHPTFKVHDLAAVAPVSDFCGDGLYVLLMLGQPCIYRVRSDHADGLTLSFDSPEYPIKRPSTFEQFRACPGGSL
jgi:phage repressor protein C with HTH and peptisase S24 domain